MKNCQSNSDPTCREGEVKEAALCKSVQVHWLKEVCAHLNHSRNISNHFRSLEQEEYLYEFSSLSVKGVVLFESGDRRNVPGTKRYMDWSVFEVCWERKLRAQFKSKSLI